MAFGTFTDELERLRDWLREHKVRQVAMDRRAFTGFPFGTSSSGAATAGSS
jgi:hypothetical protein